MNRKRRERVGKKIYDPKNIHLAKFKMQGTTGDGMGEEERFERHRHRILKHPQFIIFINDKERDWVRKNNLKDTGIKLWNICKSSFSSLYHFHQWQREGLSEEERFERGKTERQRIAELLAEREKLLSRLYRIVFLGETWVRLLKCLVLATSNDFVLAGRI